MPVIRKFDHSFMLLNLVESTLVESYLNQSETFECHLAKPQLRQLYRRLRQLSTQKFALFLRRSGHDFDYNIIKRFAKYNESCQVHGKLPGRFKFTIRDDCEFNFSVYIDVT